MELNGTLVVPGTAEGGEAAVLPQRSIARDLRSTWVMVAALAILAAGVVVVVAAVQLVGPQPAGTVSGGGSFMSGPGAYAADPELSGPARFILEASCATGGESPTGRATLVVPAADFAFSSSSCEWVALSSGVVKMAGTGTVNGAGDYGFMLTATDRPDGDWLHMTVWDRVTDTVVYDNEPAGDIGHVYPKAANLTEGSIEMGQ